MGRVSKLLLVVACIWSARACLSADDADERLWSLQPVTKPVVPGVNRLQHSSENAAADGPRAIKNPIDLFVLAKLQANHLSLAPPGDKRTLIRRATYDLTGLPPLPEEVDAFLADTSPDAFAKVVDRLLASPRYGERWGRHWLDLVRYADTAGENSDHPLPHAWRYRNWVIQAFNQDKPYDGFVREQIAGDVLAKQEIATAPGPEQSTGLQGYADQVVATGYLAIARRFGHDIDKDMHLTHEDVLDNLGKTVLGLSLGCCRCHDHKYDPLTMRDYYGLYGVFESTRFAFPGCEPKQQPRDLVPLVPESEAAAARHAWSERTSAVDAELKQLTETENSKSKVIQESISRNSRLLSSGDMEDGKSADLAGTQRSDATPAADTARYIEASVRRGEVIQIAILPRANHGADSTLLEFEIAEVGGENRHWNVANLVPRLGVANPHPGASGVEPVWCFLDTRDGPKFLTEKLDAIDNRQELKAWRGGDTPSVFVNTADVPVTVWTKLAARSFFVHPGPNGPVAVAWLSPIDGLVRVTGRIADAHPGGDGVAWRIEHFTDSELAGAMIELGRVAAARHEMQRVRALEVGAAPVIPVAYAVTDGTAKNARLQRRGDPVDLGEEIPRKFINVLGGESLDTDSSSGRLELANQLTSPSNPLTARVMVNRIWQQHFGKGVVRTPNDFGTRGQLPTHPELLDWLASEFVESGWSIKAMHRLIMLSGTYQQGSAEPTSFGGEPDRLRPDTLGAQAAMTDPANTLYWRFDRRRLSAEEIRDTLIALSGQLDSSPGGPHPFPAESSWNFTQHNPFSAVYETNRRSVYLMVLRNRRHPFLGVFDGADPNASTAERQTTIVPTQALYFMNDAFVHDCSNRLADWIMRADAGSRGELIYRQCFGRLPTPTERGEVERFIDLYQAELADSTGDQRLRAAWAAYVRVLFGSNEMLFVD